MTVREALIYTVSYPVPAGAIDLALLDGNLNGSDMYLPPTGRKELYKAAVGVLISAIVLKSESEGAYNVTYDTSLLRQRIRYLAGLAGLTDIVDEYSDAQPKIKNVTHLW